MQRMNKWTVVAVISVMSLLLLTSLAMAQPRPMPEDVFTPLTKGYDLMRAGKYEAAEFEFKTALQRDRYNPFALNNLAAVAAQQGKYKDALAYLTDAQTYAKDYLDKYQEVCFTDGLCTGVKPVKVMGTESTIAKVVQENMTKLKAKMATMPEKPVPSTPPPMEEKKK
jgi:tetratricopeptide (TPR) repeat protein